MHTHVLMSSVPGEEVDYASARDCSPPGAQPAHPQLRDVRLQELI